MSTLGIEQLFLFVFSAVLEQLLCSIDTLRRIDFRYYFPLCASSEDPQKNHVDTRHLAANNSSMFVFSAVLEQPLWTIDIFVILFSATLRRLLVQESSPMRGSGRRH